MSLITLNLNGIMTPIKRQSLSRKIKVQLMLSTKKKDYLKCKDTDMLKVKMEKDTMQIIIRKLDGIYY